MSLKSKSIKYSGNFSKLIMLMCLSVYFVFWSAKIAAQVEVTRYLPVNGTLIKFQATIAPAIPTVDYIYESAPHTVEINWSMEVGASSYKIESIVPGSVDWVLVYEGTVAPHFALDLAAGTHSFRISSCGGGLCSLPSAVVQVFIEQDTDRDGVVDSLEICPGTPAGVIVSEAGCEPTTADLDNDGVTDDVDYCVNLAGSTDQQISINGQNTRGCSLSEQDSDGDGQTDNLDAYPLQSSLQCPIQ